MTRLSRRKVVVGLGSVPMLAHSKLARAVEADPVLLLCAQYGDLARRQDTLMRCWGDHEDWLAKHRNWFSLSDAEQGALPEAQRLYVIDDEYERCVRENARLVRRLRSTPAYTVDGVAAKLGVVADVIDPEGYPSAHRVLLSAIRDLRTMRGRV